jgi:zinc protease
LENGLRVILRPVAGARQTAVLTLFSIGGDHDPDGQSGLAHFIEHLYVTAAAGERPAGTAEELMRAYPAGWNAQTGDDYTVFATVVDGSQVDAEIKHHAERMGSLRITDTDLRRELPRIEQELANMFGRMPAIAASNLARERVRPTPLGGRKGGRMEHLRKIMLPQLQSRWEAYYKPQNALLVVAGAFDTEHVRRNIKTAFGSLPSGKEIPAATAPKKLLPAAAELVDVTPIQPGLPSVASLTFSVPPPSSADYPTFLVLFHRLMAASPTGAFNASSTEPAVRYALLDDPNVLSIVTQMLPDETLDQVDARLKEFVRRAANAPWQAAEPAMTKQNLALFLGTMPLPDLAIAGNVYGVAFSVGRQEQLGVDGQSLAKKLDRVRERDLKRIAEKYFASNSGAVIVVRAKDQ